ncbi:MAG TPA: transglutaminase family protein [Bryobacteraceae bacterium]|jgi:transglutaminase-like putative cysteine protease|nr:transglutaminase family protein [Bryobacteraceae bacterium]
MRLLATHKTRYWYSGPVSMCHTEVHLQPRPRTNQTILEFELDVSPTPDSLLSREDYFGNQVTFFSIAEPHRELIITSRCLADVEASTPPALELSPAWEQVRDDVAKRDTPDTFEAGQFVFESPSIRIGEPFAQYAASSFPAGRPLLSGVEDLSRRVYTDFHYDKHATTIGTPVDDVLKSRRGVCQDFAHLMIACLRSLSLPARYVSGYLRTGGDFTGEEASHAWVSAWCPVFGWQDFDPTNNVMPRGDHFTVAWGRDYSDVTPVKGVALGGGEQVISVSVDVSPDPSPQATD